jgi:hypothetical protein
MLPIRFDATYYNNKGGKQDETYNQLTVLPSASCFYECQSPNLQVQINKLACSLSH